MSETSVSSAGEEIPSPNSGRQRNPSLGLDQPVVVSPLNSPRVGADGNEVQGGDYLDAGRDVSGSPDSAVERGKKSNFSEGLGLHE